VGDLPPIFAKLRAFTEMFNEDGIKAMLGEAGFNMEEELDFESFLKVN
jgi:plastin-1